MPRLTFVLLLLSSGLLTAGAQQPRGATGGAAVPAPNTLLRADPSVRVGTLPNGLRYYIRRNAKPEKRAELRLVVNAGSVLEDDTQLGYAHFIEHTAFNGTTHFAKNDLVSYLQTIGVQFGADLNAQTGVDETIYILPVSTDSAAIVAKAFQILEDWAHGQVFDSAQVVGERGVVREEWRGRKGAGERVFRQTLPIELRGSKYASRIPIGTEASIMGATPGGLRSFYSRWYRPDLMAVIAVGDFDPARIEEQIRSHFAGIPRAPHPTPRPTVDVPGNTAPLVAIATDPELTGTTVEVAYKARATPTRTVADYRRDLIASLYLGMLNARLSEVAQRPGAPFLGARASKGQYFVRGMDAFDLVASVREGGAEQGLAALLTETRRVDQFGFLQGELDRAKQSLLRAYERAYTERDKTSSGALVREYVDNFLRGDAMPGIEMEYQLAQGMVPTIALADVNHSARQWITDANRVVTVTAPARTGLAAPTEQQILTVFARTARAPVTAYSEHVSTDALVATMPTAGHITLERVVPGTDVTEWTLSNGARVLIKSTDFAADEVLFAASASGGTSLAPNEDFMSAELSAQLISLGGVGALSRVDLVKRLSGKAVGVVPVMSETSEGLSGSASPKDVETLLALAYLEFTAPRQDTLAYQAFRARVLTGLQNRGADPGTVFADTVVAMMSQHDFRSRPVSVATFGEVNLDRAFEFYRARFADAGNFTFVFVGTIERAILRPLVERYLASLPSTGRHESWKRVTNGPPTGVLDVAVHKGTENKATTVIAFTGPFEYTPGDRFAMRSLTDYLQIKLTETLREQLGGTYSPGVGSRNSKIPREEYAIQVSFASSPENVSTLTRAVYALIDTLVRAGPSAADAEKVQAQMLRQREVEVKQNDYWLNNLVARRQAGEDLAGLGAAYDRMIRGLTPALIQSAARQYLDMRNHARFVLVPEALPAVP
jgi:zinc protease